MASLVGQKTRFADLPAAYNANSSASLTLSTTETDITGATVTISTVRANTVVQIHATYDFRITVIGTNFCRGRVAIDGVTQTGQAVFLAQAAETRNASRIVLTATIVAAGSHIVKLRGSKDAAGGTGIIESGSCTGVTVVVYP